MSKSLIDQEAFQAWWEHPVGLWYRRRLMEQAKVTAQDSQDRLWALLPGNQQEWLNNQAGQAYQRGQVDGFVKVVEMTYDDVREETVEEIEAMEKKQ